MTYSTATTQKFTLIDNLPDLDDLEENKVGDKYNKFIRNNHSPTPMQAGMSSPQDHAMALDTEPMAILAATARNLKKPVGPLRQISILAQFRRSKSEVSSRT